MHKKLKTLSVVITGLSLLINLVPGLALAQTVSPTSLPLVQSSNMTYLGKFTYPYDDGAGGNLTYGYKTLGMGADGASLYVGCIYGPVARISIPAIGGVAKVLEPCQKPTNIGAINPGDSNGIYMGGALAWQGKLITSAYAYYDAGGTAKGSHFVGTTVANSTGPFTVGTMNPGFVGGNMGPIPQEWRSLLGGPSFTSQWGLSIIGRTSSGPAFTVFDPAQVGVVNPVPASMLIGYPLSNTNPAVGYYGNTSTANAVYDMGSGPGGVAFPDGTRSILFIHRVGTTAACYGEGTTNPALDRQPVPGYNGAVIYCYDLSNMYKGGHQYPYKHQVVAYDANDLIAVKNGTKNPWDVVPYARWYLNDINNNGSADLRGATYDPATKRIYITNENGGGTPEVHVYQLNIGTAVTPTPDTTAPTVSLMAPTSGSTVSGSNVTVSANASDNVGVAGVQFKLDGANLGVEDTTAPYSTIWNTTSYLNAAYSITAVARDSAGNTTTSTSVSATVNNVVPTTSTTPTTTTPVLDTTKPAVSISAPAPMTTTYGMPILISADATDNVGVVGVQFQLDGINFGSEDLSSPYSIIWDTKSTTIEGHNITAIARDAAGNKTLSSGVSVVVTDPAPVIPVATTTPTTPTTELVPVPTPTPTTPTEQDVAPVVVGLKIGDRIKTTAWINVRSTAGGRYVGSQRTGKTGTITAGPVEARDLVWWKVNFTSGADGWVAEKFITKVTVAMTDDDYRKNIANIYLIIKYLQERIAGQN